MEGGQTDAPSENVRDRALAIFYGAGGVALCVFAGYLLVRLWPVALLLLISLIFVAALTPIVKRIEDRYNRKTATTLVVTALLVGILSLVAVTVPPVLSQLDTLARDFEAAFDKIRAEVAEGSPATAEMLDRLKVATLPSQTEPHAVREVVSSAFTLVTGFVTVLMLTAYLIIEGPAVATALVGVVPRNNRLAVRRMFSEFGEQAGAYLRGQITTSFCAGAFTYVLLTAFSVPNALALAWIMAVFDAIPVVGAILGSVPAIVSAYGVDDEKAIYVLVALVAYHNFDNYWLVPRVYGRALKLSPLTVLLTIMVGVSLLGMVGAFIALPFAAVVPIFLRYFNAWRNQEPDEPDLPGNVAE
jgi:predicted PurR-regulated permease PerM